MEPRELDKAWTMTPWVTLKSLVLLVLLSLPVVQGQTCNMVSQTDKKISDQFQAVLKVINGPTDFDSCSTACLGEADCIVVEYRSSLCIYVADDTALTDQPGSSSALKVCTNTDTTSTYESTTEDSGATSTYVSTTESSAHATRPRLVAVAMATVLAILWSRRG